MLNRLKLVWPWSQLAALEKRLDELDIKHAAARAEAQLYRVQCEAAVKRHGEISEFNQRLVDKVEQFEIENKRLDAKNDALRKEVAKLTKGIDLLAATLLRTVNVLVDELAEIETDMKHLDDLASEGKLQPAAGAAEVGI